MSTTQLPTDSGLENKVIITKPVKFEAEIIESRLSWTTPGTYTWTAPSYASKIRVTVVGGGGGGGETDYGRKGTSGTGGTSSFDTIIATGGKGAYTYSRVTNPDHGQSTITTRAGAGGKPNGKSGTSGIGFNLSSTMEDGIYGAGGMTYNRYNKYATNGGGSGGFISQEIEVNPGKVYNLTVGSGGSKIGNGKVGNSGFVLIELL